MTLTDDDLMGESRYNDSLASVCDELERKDLAVASDGALCVFLPGFTGRDGRPVPLIIRTSDGGYGYATTDLATIKYRVRELHADRIVYVIGAPQHLHLQMVFQTARLAGWLPEGVVGRGKWFWPTLREAEAAALRRAMPIGLAWCSRGCGW